MAVLEGSGAAQILAAGERGRRDGGDLGPLGHGPVGRQRLFDPGRPNSASLGAMAQAERRSQPWLTSTIRRSPAFSAFATGRSEPKSVASPKPTFILKAR